MSILPFGKEARAMVQADTDTVDGRYQHYLAHPQELASSLQTIPAVRDEDPTDAQARLGLPGLRNLAQRLPLRSDELWDTAGTDDTMRTVVTRRVHRGLLFMPQTVEVQVVSTSTSPSASGPFSEIRTGYTQERGGWLGRRVKSEALTTRVDNNGSFVAGAAYSKGRASAAVSAINGALLGPR